LNIEIIFTVVITLWKDHEKVRIFDANDGSLLYFSNGVNELKRFDALADGDNIIVLYNNKIQMIHVKSKKITWEKYM
jgi:hypothetical protein